MKHLKNHHVWFPALAVLTIVACHNKEIMEVEETMEVEGQEPESKAVVLGKELEIPYTTANMQVALNNLMANLKGRSKNSKLAMSFKTEEAIQVVPSHYYYRFLPKDSLEYELIAQDTILHASNVPLHHEIEEDGDYYDDPELEGDESADAFSSLFAVVPYDYPIPEQVQSERLDDFYFAPEDNKEALEEGEIVVKQPHNKTTTDMLTADNSGEVFEYLELEALKLTNNLEEEELGVLRFYLPKDTTATSYSFADAKALGYEQKDLIIDLNSINTLLEQERASRRRSWRPSGRITVQEDALNMRVGVAGAEVKVRKWGLAVIRRTRTNNNGEFRTSSTRTKRVKYAVYFNSPGRFVVKSGTIFRNARHRGTRTYRRRPWNRHFSYGRSQFYALVHNAAHDYYTRVVPTYGLRRPHKATISAKYLRDVSSEHRPAVFVFASSIRVTRLSNNRYRGSDGVYATTVHELTHAGHRDLDPGIFSIFARSCRRNMLMESWAEGVETIVTNDRYNRLQSGYYNDLQNLGWNSERQRERATAMNEYSPIVIDLVDEFNQNTRNNIWPIDNVEGYSLADIQSALKGSRTANTWRNKLNANRPNGVTTAELNTLFSYMDQILLNSETCK